MFVLQSIFPGRIRFWYPTQVSSAMFQCSWCARRGFVKTWPYLCKGTNSVAYCVVFIVV